MESNILDHRFHDNEDIKKALSKGGVERFYEIKNKNILVETSDAVRVTVQLENGKATVKPKFPQIGNAVQVVVTILLFILSFALNLSFSWLIAFIGGQLVSYVWFKPKINQLKSKVEKALLKNG